MPDPVHSLPEQVVHRPFQAGRYRMAMDLVAVPEVDWFEFDQRYLSEMAERQRLLSTVHSDVFAALPVSDAARQEALKLIVTALAMHHPGWFSYDRCRNDRCSDDCCRIDGCSGDGATVRNHLTGEAWNRRGKLWHLTGGGLDTGPIDPLELAGRLVQEDLCLIQNSDDAPIFTAAVLCFPSRWRLLDKLGKPLSAVHGPVPLYADRLARPVDRFMRHLKPGHIASRLNWSLLDDPTLFQPGGKWRMEGGSDVTPENAGNNVFLRVERQTLRRLPHSLAVLFGIRVHVYPLDQVIDRPDRAAELAEAVRALPMEIQHYKSLLPFRQALLAWCDCQANT